MQGLLQKGTDSEIEPIWAAQAGQRWRGTVLALDLLGQILYPQSHLVFGDATQDFRESLYRREPRSFQESRSDPADLASMPTE